MAESVTYADLRFVKAPLKKRISSQLGQDPETDDDGELTYENVQVPQISGGASNLASSGLGDKAGVQSEPPTASWSSVTSPAARRLLDCCSAYSKYLLLGLLLTCLLLGMAAISLVVRYLQVSHQLQYTNRVLEATNSSLLQQLGLKITQLVQREQDLQGSRRELVQSQEALRVEQRDCQAVKEQLQVCLSNEEKTKEALRREEEQRRTLEERLNRMRDTLKPFFTCQSAGSCCPVGWIPTEKNCFYVSVAKRSWEQSRSYCQSLSSNLSTVSSHSYSDYYDSSSYKFWKEVEQSGPYWVDPRWKTQKVTEDRRASGSNHRCFKTPNSWPYWRLSQTECNTNLPCICEMAAFSYPG